MGEEEGGNTSSSSGAGDDALHGVLDAYVNAEPPREQKALPEGSIIGSYRIERCLGQGATGFVYLGRHLEKSDQIRAIKVLDLRTPGLEEWRPRFLNEIEIASKVKHPNISSPDEVFQTEEFIAFTMEYISGGDLAEWMKAHTTVNFKEAIRILIQICDGVRVLHDAGIVHRDLKPANILLSASGEVRISDFATARAEDKKRITARGGILGTINYLSPEYIADGALTPLCDIYALGTIAFEIFTGRLPFKGSNTYDTISQMVQNEAPPVSSVNSACPPVLDEIIAKALKRDPAARTQSAAEIRASLSALLLLKDLPEEIPIGEVVQPPIPTVQQLGLVEGASRASGKKVSRAVVAWTTLIVALLVTVIFRSWITSLFPSPSLLFRHKIESKPKLDGNKIERDENAGGVAKPPTPPIEVPKVPSQPKNVTAPKTDGRPLTVISPSNRATTGVPPKNKAVTKEPTKLPKVIAVPAKEPKRVPVPAKPLRPAVQAKPSVLAPKPKPTPASEAAPEKLGETTNEKKLEEGSFRSPESEEVEGVVGEVQPIETPTMRRPIVPRGPWH